MRSNASPLFFHACNNNNAILNKEFKAQRFDLTVILDPNIFFIMHNGVFLIHPIIQSWLDAAKNNSNINRLHVYLLSRMPGPPEIYLGNDPEPYQFQLGSHFFDLLHPKYFEYINNLWHGKLQIATLSNDAHTGISDFTDGYYTNGNDIIVISADAQLCDFFANKNISTRCMDAPNLPVMSRKIDDFDNSKLAVYSDFDGTLFNVNHYLVYKLITSQLDQTANNQEPPTYLQLDTIKFLQELQEKNHPVHLLTQRTYKIDQTQSPENNALDIIHIINERYNLSIKANVESYLNSHEQIERNAQKEKPDDKHHVEYLAKIEALYQRMKECPAESRPKNIMLIDDDLREILKFYYLRPYYKSLDIELHATLIMKLAYYDNEALNLIASYDPQLYKQIEYNYNQELAKLDSGVEEVKIKQGMNQINDIMDDIHERADLQYVVTQNDLSVDLQTPTYTPRCTIF